MKKILQLAILFTTMSFAQLANPNKGENRNFGISNSDAIITGSYQLYQNSNSVHIAAPYKVIIEAKSKVIFSAYSYGIEIQRAVNYDDIAFAKWQETAQNSKTYEDKDAGIPAQSQQAKSRVRQPDSDDDNNSNSTEAVYTAPKKYELYQNYPNPFNPSTVINFQTAYAGKVTLKVYNVLGKEVATLVNRELSAGSHSAKFTAGNLTSGLYFYTLTAGNFSSTKKMILIK